MQRLLAAAVLFITLGGCSFESGCGWPFGGSCGSSIEFDGARFGGMGAQDLRIQETDLELIGTANETTSNVESRDVYALAGVDPGHIVVMRAAGEEEFILYVRGDLEYTAGFCAYFIEPPPECG